MTESYVWAPAYRRAVVETDDTLLRRRLDEARLVLTVRLREIGTGASRAAERSAIEEAFQALKTLEKERLASSDQG